MKLIKTLMLVVVVLVVMTVVSGFFMNPEWQVERRATVAAGPSEVYAYISHLQNWPQWTAWNSETYPHLSVSYSGPEAGVGARQSWNDGVMSGTLEITAVQPGQYFDYQVSMDGGRHEMQCRLAVAAKPGGSEVIWTCTGHSGGNPLQRVMMAAYRPLIGKEFDQGLGHLQQQFAREERA